MLVQHEIVYSDVNKQANLQPFDIVTNLDEAIQRLLLVLATPRGSRWKRYRFGCDIVSFLFDPLDPTTATSIRENIEDSVLEPENDLLDIQITELEVIPDYVNQNYYVSMRVSVPTLESRVVSFSLRRL